VTTHGEQRAYRVERREAGPPRKYVAPNIGVLSVPSGYIAESVSERYCEDCGWQEQRGVLAPLFGCPSCERSWDA
jgi:hypothetical protein